MSQREGPPLHVPLWVMRTERRIPTWAILTLAGSAAVALLIAPLRSSPNNQPSVPTATTPASLEPTLTNPPLLPAANPTSTPEKTQAIAAQLAETTARIPFRNWLTAVLRTPGTSVSLLDCTMEKNQHNLQENVGLLGEISAEAYPRLNQRLGIPSVGADRSPVGLDYKDVVNWIGEIEVKKPGSQESWTIGLRVINAFKARAAIENAFSQREIKSGPGTHSFIKILKGDLRNCTRISLGENRVK